VSGGQYFLWRFTARGLWLYAHPYSISAVPQPPYMRVTIKGLGAHSSAAARLTPGTRIAIEGPYGTFTKHALTGRRVAMIAAGVGVTPVRALLEDLPPGADPVVVLRASTEEELLLGNEVRELARAHGWTGARRIRVAQSHDARSPHAPYQYSGPARARRVHLRPRAVHEDGCRRGAASRGGAGAAARRGLRRLTRRRQAPPTTAARDPSLVFGAKY
jgi:ferredoxin-NADP reductase